MNSLTASQAKEMLIHVADRVVASKEMLCDADRNIGDGDHGIGMANGLAAARQELEGKEFDDVYTVFSTVGRTMIRVMGGASGIIFGLLFWGGAKNHEPKGEITPGEFAEIFERSLAEIQAKGQAKPGDKTIIDGLLPMVEAMKNCVEKGASFPEMIAEASRAAEEGKEKSREYIARHGKAKTLGERSIGFPDAGCVSLTVIMKAMEEWVQQNR